MNALIVYDSKFGNTERIARAVAWRLGTAGLIRAEEVGELGRPDCELLIVAGPTQRQGVSPAIRELLERIPRGALKDVPAAAFDTRYRMSLLSGSAAVRIASRLKKAGVRFVVPPESFFIERDVPPKGEKRRHEMERLEPGEEERAREWAAIILERMGVALEQGGR